MTTYANIFKDNKFRLVVQHTDTKNLGRCYDATYWTVYSLWPLSIGTLELIVPHGQEFAVTDQSFDKELGMFVYHIREATDSSD